MEKFYLASTKSTPKVEFNPDVDILIIEGESYPENAFKFYEPIFEWLENYFSDVQEEVTFEIKLNYLNTSSVKSIMNIFDIVEVAKENEKNIIINWYYDKENESLYEIAEDFKEDLTVEFNIIAE